MADYDAWKVVYDEVAALRDKHGVTGERIFREAADSSTVLVLQEVPTVDAAEAYADDPELKEAMQRAGVVGPPRIEIYEEIG